MKNLTEAALNYLKYLNLPLEAPSFQYLERICHSHLNTFPFENISKLLYFRDRNQNQFDIPSFEMFVENFRKYNFGGTCYTLNSNLLLLLKELGFECYHIMLGKEHMGIIVKIDNERVYVDCGAAAPFFKPVRFERNPQNVSQFGDDKVHLLPVQAEKNEYKYVRYIQNKQNGKTWEFNSAQQFKVSDFNQVIQQSNTPKAPFMVILRCQLWQTEQRRSVSLVNNKFGIRYADGHTIIKKLNSTKEIEEVIVDEFRLPKLPVSEAINVLNDLNINIFSE